MEFGLVMGWVYNILILLTAIPAGLLLAWLCKEELVPGRKWFFIILYSLAIVMVVFLVYYINLSIILSLIYMIIVTIISIWKSKDKKFLRN